MKFQINDVAQFFYNRSKNKNGCLWIFMIAYGHWKKNSKAPKGL